MPGMGDFPGFGAKKGTRTASPKQKFKKRKKR
jgi:hypothetical protein